MIKDYLFIEDENRRLRLSLCATFPRVECQTLAPSSQDRGRFGGLVPPLDGSNREDVDLKLLAGGSSVFSGSWLFLSQHNIYYVIIIIQY